MLVTLSIFFTKKYKISLLNTEWGLLISNLKIRTIPRYGELIYIEDLGYFEVINVIHNIRKKIGIFVVVEKLDHTKNLVSLSD